MKYKTKKKEKKKKIEMAANGRVLSKPLCSTRWVTRPGWK
jgi:hypothetical protein